MADTLHTSKESFKDSFKESAKESAGSLSFSTAEPELETSTVPFDPNTFNSPVDETITCKNCGEVNDVGNAVCVNCNTPLTAYGGQVGQEENYTSLSSAQIDALEERPPVVVAMTAFNVLFALAVPLWTVLAAWFARPHMNQEGTNGFQAAAGTFVSILETLTLLPAAILLCAVAYFTWTQRPWAWTANAVVLGGVAVLALLLHGFSLMTFIWIGLACGFAYYWFQPQVKAWFALD